MSDSHCSRKNLTPYDARLEVSTEWSTELKAFETSRKRTPMTRPASRALYQSFVVMNRVVAVECKVLY